MVHLVVDQRAEASEIPAAVLRPGAPRRLRREILVGETEPPADDGLEVVDGALPRGLDAEVLPPAVMLGVVLIIFIVLIVLIVLIVVVGPQITEGVGGLADRASASRRSCAAKTSLAKSSSAVGSSAEGLSSTGAGSAPSSPSLRSHPSGSSIVPSRRAPPSARRELTSLPQSGEHPAIQKNSECTQKVL